jgi:hypothetical protein
MYDPGSSYSAISIRIPPSSTEPNQQVKNIVIYNNHFHNMGDGRTTPVKKDAVGVAVSPNAENIWIVDNYMHHIGGDGVQVNYDWHNNDSIIPNHIYIGRNIFHDNFENAIDLKTGEDVIVSQNIAHNFGEGHSEIVPEGRGPYTVFRYGPGDGPMDADGLRLSKNNIWTLFNLAYNVNSGDSGAFASFTFIGVEKLADEIYYIGNIAYNCHNDANTSSAFGSLGQEKIYWVNNLAYNCDGGGGFWIANDDPNQSLTLINNIFAESGTDIRGYIVVGTKTQGPSNFSNLTMSNNLFYQDSGPGKISFYEWNANQARLQYSEYTIDELEAAKPDQIQNTIEANPQFLSTDPLSPDFLRPDSTSPTIDNGTDAQVYYDRFYARYGIDISVDFEGNPRPQGAEWDIGAYESVGAGTPSLSPFTKIWNFLKGFLTKETGSAITGNAIIEDGDKRGVEDNFFMKIIEWIKNLIS